MPNPTDHDREAAAAGEIIGDVERIRAFCDRLYKEEDQRKLDTLIGEACAYLEAQAKALSRPAGLEALREALDLSEKAMRADLKSEIESACCLVDGEYLRDTADPYAEPWLQAKERALEAIAHARQLLSGDGGRE